jgi:hypothetical protein
LARKTPGSPGVLPWGRARRAHAIGQTVQWRLETGKKKRGPKAALKIGVFSIDEKLTSRRTNSIGFALNIYLQITQQAFSLSQTNGARQATAA